MSSRSGSFVSSPSWGARRSDALAGAVLFTVWLLLWTFFTTAVLAPGAKLHGAAGVEPSEPRVARTSLAIAAPR